jgi:hypothetical protein
MSTLKWTKADSGGSYFSKGKHDHYAIIRRKIPEEQPKDCIVELYATDKEMTASELKISRDRGHINPISRSIIVLNLPHVTRISQSIQGMKQTAEKRENEMPKF